MLPLLARKLVYPLQERLLDRPTFPYLAELERSQWLSRSGMQKLQEEKLAKILKSAYEHCPWHQERMNAASIDPASPVSLKDLQRLPTMNKQDALLHGKQMVWHAVPGGAFKYNTGGSSGQPLIFYYGRRRQASDAAGRMRARSWWGVEPGDREVYLWGAPVELNNTDRIKSLRDRMINQLVLNAFEMSPAAMDKYVQAIQAFQPHCIYGYASSLALLAAHILERKAVLRLAKLKVVCTTGEPLFDYQRELISDAFGSKVANEFGSRDIGFTAHESPQGQMLLMNESIILEVLDEQGRPVPSGETGEAVMTALESFAQPFIRYRTGDMVRMSNESCREGRGLDVIAEVLGRSTDFVVRADGTIMHALAVIYVLRAVEGVAEFKIIQHSLHEFEVLVVPNASWQECGHLEIERGLHKRLGDDIHINLRLVDSIPAEASGKHRYVVSRVSLTDDLKAATQAQVN